jgi:16S rRNA (uracil1498-N3)-methyltransferase
VISEFGNVQIEQTKIDKKLSHWRKIIINACEQSGRTILPELLAPISFAQGVQDDTHTMKLLLHPGAQQRLSNLLVDDASLCLLSGPEGGFSQSEIDLAVDSDYIPVELGPRVLRTETAAVAAISACQTLWGDMA